MKRFTFFISMILIMIIFAVPIFAEFEENSASIGEKGAIGVNYYPVSISSSSGNLAATVGAFKFYGEAFFSKAMSAGLIYTYGSGGDFKQNNVTFTNPTLTDLNVYLKFPVNYNQIAESQKSGTKDIEPSPFSGLILYKSTLLKTDTPNNMTWENASGPGIGVGLDTKFETGAFNAQISYFPRMQVHSIANPLPNTEYWVNTVEYKLQFKFKLKENWGVNVGYAAEQHQYQNLTLTYSGFLGGVEYKF